MFKVENKELENSEVRKKNESMNMFFNFGKLKTNKLTSMEEKFLEDKKNETSSMEILPREMK